MKPVLRLADRDQYTPSWMKSSRQLKKTPLPPPGGSGKVVVTNGSQAGVKGATENPMKAYETPKWKMELAEKKKRREAEVRKVERVVQLVER